MSWVDLIVLVVWGFYVWYSWGKGWVESLAEGVTWVGEYGILKLFWVPFEFYLVRSYGLSREWAVFISLLFLLSVFGLVIYLSLRAVSNRWPKQYGSKWQYILVGLPATAVAGALAIGLVVLWLRLLPVGDLEGVLGEESMFWEMAGDLFGWLHG